jgi:hypothetical protein
VLQQSILQRRVMEIRPSSHTTIVLSMEVSIRLSHLLKSVLYHHLRCITFPTAVKSLACCLHAVCLRLLDGNSFLGQFSTSVVGCLVLRFQLTSCWPRFQMRLRNRASQMHVERVRTFDEIGTMLTGTGGISKLASSVGH